MFKLFSAAKKSTFKRESSISLFSEEKELADLLTRVKTKVAHLSKVKGALSNAKTSLDRAVAVLDQESRTFEQHYSSYLSTLDEVLEKEVAEIVAKKLDNLVKGSHNLSQSKSFLEMQIQSLDLLLKTLTDFKKETKDDFFKAKKQLLSSEKSAKELQDKLNTNKFGKNETEEEVRSKLATAAENAEVAKQALAELKKEKLTKYNTEVVVLEQQVNASFDKKISQDLQFAKDLDRPSSESEKTSTDRGVY